MTMTLRYSELIEIPSFEDRFEYARLIGRVGAETFGSARYTNQMFYRSNEWKRFRDAVIIRDEGCDLGIPGRLIHGRIIVHHLNPITEEDLYHGSPSLLDMENAICVSFITHQAIHYGDKDLLYQDPVERYPNDTCPWKGGKL